MLVMLALGSGEAPVSAIGIIVALACVAAFGTHWCWFVARCWRRRVDPVVLALGVLGILVPLVGALHGFCIWIGARVSAKPERAWGKRRYPRKCRKAGRRRRAS